LILPPGRPKRQARLRPLGRVFQGGLWVADVFGGLIDGLLTGRLAVETGPDIPDIPEVDRAITGLTWAGLSRRWGAWRRLVSRAAREG